MGVPAHCFIRRIHIHVDENMFRRWDGDENLSAFEALKLLRPSAWPVLILDVNKRSLHRSALIWVFESVLSKLWDYITVMNLSRLDIEVWMSTNGLDSTILMNGSPDLADWTSELKRVSA
jgi:hypothetical protein